VFRKEAAMKFGLFYLFSDFGTITQDRLLHEVLEEITYAEELGFESVWLPEHHFAIYGMLGNPMIFAASIAERTRTMKIGTAIMVVPFQHPLRGAEDAAMVDALSHGRLLLGLGRGGFQWTIRPSEATTQTPSPARVSAWSSAFGSIGIIARPPIRPSSYRARQQLVELRATIPGIVEVMPGGSARLRRRSRWHAEPSGRQR